MQKKLGPLKTWQWLAIGAAFGVAYYIYKARQANASSNVGGAAVPSATTGLGPIDPTTGQPYALEALGNQANGTNAQNSGPTSLQQELGDLGQIEALLSGISEIPTNTGANPATGTVNVGSGSTVNLDKVNNTLKKLQQQVKVQGLELTHPIPKGGSYAFGKKPPAKKGFTIKGLGKGLWAYIPKPKSNPGHHVTHHPSGGASVSSSAPHNAQQHRNVAPPHHQRHRGARTY